MTAVLNKNDIKNIIPHREPMLLVDEIIEMEAEKSITSRFFVDPAMEIFKGHFPDEPVLPGVYSVEIMAQTCDVLMLSLARYSGKTPLFLGVDRVSFKSKIKPGDTLETRAELVSERPEKAIVTLSAEVFDGGTLAASGLITLAMR